MAVIVLGKILVPFVICFHTNSLKGSKSFYILFWSHYRYRYELGLHNLPFIYATLVQFIMIKQLAYIKKKQ